MWCYCLTPNNTHDNRWSYMIIKLEVVYINEVEFKKLLEPNGYVEDIKDKKLLVYKK